MRIKSIVTGAALAFALSAGAAFAADDFATLEGISAKALSSAELASVQGAAVTGTLTFTGRFTKMVSPDESVPFTGDASVTINPGTGAAVTADITEL